MIKKITVSFLLLVILSVGVVAVKSPGGVSGFWLMVTTITGLNQVETSSDVAQSYLHLPEGFTAEIFADGLDVPRVIVVTQTDDIIVSLVDSGEVLLLRDLDNDGQAESKTILLQGLANPQGLAFDGDWLYVAERHRVIRIQYDHSNGVTLGEAETVIDDLPFGHPHRSHNAKTIGISADRKLYITVGSPCNVCIPDDPRYSAILRAELNGSNVEIYARGLRNSVGFDWAPWSGELYATDNGRDMLGDDFPPDELNLIVKEGFYGWPYLHGDNVPDPEFGEPAFLDENPEILASARLPSFKFRAHNAPLGIHFIKSTDNLPKAYSKTALVALHGSWNRSKLDGYKILSLHWNSDGSIESRDFMTGFLGDKGIVGRPVSIVENAAGQFYITDDLGGRIYRITYTQPH
ncbi:MAG TPA: oxidoreductase [Cellvibrionales bacterium]|nr:oxidoreductase [Cellvibrionales bacterium]